MTRARAVRAAWLAVAAALAAVGCAGKSAPAAHPDSGAGGAPVDQDAADQDAADAPTVADGPPATTDAPPGEPVAFDGGACPTTAPFDDTDATLVAACTQPVVVAVGNNLRRASSLDGQTWANESYTPTTGPDPNEYSHRDVLIAKGLIVIVGDGGLLVSFDGGASYTVANPKKLHESSLGYFRGTIWAVTDQGTFSSTDGKTWQTWGPTDKLPGGLVGSFQADAGIATSGTRLIASSSRTTNVRVFDGTTWTETEFDKTKYGFLWSTAYGADRFVIVGATCCDTQPFAGLRATSPDGVTWTLKTNASEPTSPALRFSDVMWDGARFFAASSGGTTYVSPNGLDWTGRKTNNQSIAEVAAFQGGYIGTNNNLIFGSPDGITWTKVFTGMGLTNAFYTHVRSGVVLRR